MLETTRLRLRGWQETDLIPFIEMNKDEDVMRYFPKTLSADETLAFYQTIQAEFDEYGYGLYAVEEKETRDFIGFIGFHHATFDASFTPCIEIGWRLKKEAWGKGYATEGAKACLQHGFEKLGFTDIYSFTAIINTPSIQVMKKIDMKQVQTFNHPKVNELSPLRKHILYQLSKE